MAPIVEEKDSPLKGSHKDDDTGVTRPSKKMKIKKDDDHTPRVETNQAAAGGDSEEESSPDNSDTAHHIAKADLSKLRSITAIVKFMDDIEPGKRYYERQQDSRKECSKLRKKLRDYAKKNKNESLGNVAVSHYAKNKWAPPTHEALAALVELLKNMIDKSWP